MKTGQIYQHGGRPEIEFSRFNMPKGVLIDFSVNLNPFGPPSLILDQWPELIGAIRDYPTIGGAGPTRYYSEKFGLLPGNILAGNGSTELIYLVPRVLRPKKVVVVTPSYHDYERASRLSGAEVVRFPLSHKHDFELRNHDTLVKALKESDMLWLGRPNNPTGTLIPKASILELAAMFPDTWFMIDEAFIQFVDQWEENSLLFDRRPANLLVVHSLTKFYSLAGLRLGGLIGDTDVIKGLKEEKEPWSINGIADSVAPLLLLCGDFDQETGAGLIRERERIHLALESLDSIRPFPGTANFILCEWKKTDDLDDLMRHLLLNGVYVRDCRNFAGLENNFFRIGLRTSDENDHLISILASF
ncbi:MAG: threonine-phosphate decarboxylase CobD [Desulfatiglans sp.]|jgi:threonine-phosphate decarboxylase|nr:threonine-phosphate decarboxylase CobD [Desulfatiglans sp.]